jgi:hypothetical protein
MISMLASLAVIGLTAAAPATSQDLATAGTAATAATSAAAPAAKPKAKLYCITEAATGTRVAERTCLTRKEWEARGVDLDQQ